MQQPKMILASSSPRRQELMTWMKIPFESTPADIDESLQQGELPLQHVQRLARQKAGRIHETYGDGIIILAADTIVIDKGRILGKPQDAAQAEEMLLALRGKTHQVATAIHIIAADGNPLTDMCVSSVKMRDYSMDEIRAYVATGDPLDKAGAYAIQNQSFHPVPIFSGCFASVMGFLFCHIERNLRKIDGYNCVPVAAICQKNLHYSCPIFSRVLDGEDIG
jgi:septum formation protein